MALSKIEKCSQSLCDVEGEVGNELVLIQDADPIKGTVRQTRCRRCNNGMGRLKRFLSAESDAKDEYTELSVEGRQKFIAKVSVEGLAGDKLKQALTESVSWTRVQKQTANFTAQGNFQTEKALRAEPDADAETVEAILKNSPTMQCQITNNTLYWKPIYSMGHDKTEESIEVRKRTLESEENIKAKKRPNVKKERAELGAAIDVAAAAARPDVDLPPAQKIRLEKCVPKIEEQQHQLVQQLAIARAPEREGQVGDKVLEKADKTNKTLEDIREKCRAIIDANKCAKGTEFLRWNWYDQQQRGIRFENTFGVQIY